MDPEAKYKDKHPTFHAKPCPRHHDLTILLQGARTAICNTCFATLKKSYYNVIAGLLLEEHYLHHLTKGLLEQNNLIQKTVNDLTEHVLNLQHEISDLKSNRRNHDYPTPKTPSAALSKPREVEPQQPPSDAQEICTKGHVAKVARSLQHLLHLQISHVLDNWKKAKHTTTPKTDDHQDSKGATHTHGGFSMP